MKIALVGQFGFNEDQMKRLSACGDVVSVADPGSSDAWLEAVQGYNIVASDDGSYIYDNLDKLHDVFATYPYIEIGAFDSADLDKRNVQVANASGGNRDSMVQWTLFMIISLLREFNKYVNIETSSEIFKGTSLSDASVLIVGAGGIGSEVGRVCEAFGMDVNYFRRGDDISKMSMGADVIVNSLNCTPSSKGLLDKNFFMSLKKGSHYVTFARQHTYDLEAVVGALDAGILKGAAIDCDPEPLYSVDNDFYQTVMMHPKILATPHLAGMTTQSGRNGNEIVVQNIENFVKGEPANLLKKI